MPMDFLRSRSSQPGKLEKYIHQEKWTKACQLLNSKAFHQDLQSKIKKAEKRYRSNQSSRSLSLQSVNSETIESVTISFIGLFNLAILYDAPLDFLSLFTEQFPDITRTKDRHGMTPLHLACATKATSLDLIQLLLRADLGKSVAVQDSSGRTPLHYFLFYICYPRHANEKLKTDKSFGPSEFQFSKQSDTSLNEDPGGKLAVSQEEFQKFIKGLNVFCRISMEPFFIRDMNGHTPIDILHECKNTDESTKRGPKWERADIVNVLVREKLVKHYRRLKKQAESAGWDTSLSNMKRAISDKSETDDTTSLTDDGSASFLTGLSKMEINSLGVEDMEMSLT